MSVTEFKLQYETADDTMSSGIPVIIAAGGSSLRMKGINKQFAELLGVPVLARTLLKFEECPKISRIIIVTRPDSILPVQELCQKYLITKVTDILEGGNNRHESVMNGFSRLSQDEKKVLIHDGARPLVNNETILDVIDALDNFDAAVCTVPVNDTVKLITADGTVDKTLDRTLIHMAQTPQGVDVFKYRQACETVDATQLTDDSAVMEAAGFRVAYTKGDKSNIKITTKEDIPLAEFYLKENGLCE